MSIIHNSPTCGDVEMLMEPAEPGFIYGLLPEDGTLVEWGCGGSTIYFLDNLKESQYLVSIEHNAEWYEKVSEMIKDHPNIDRHVFLFIPPDGVTNNYYARPEEEMPCGLNEYICFDIDTIKQADVFLVDGIARGPTAAFLATVTKPEAHVIIHDYRGREGWYGWVENCYANHEKPEGMVLCHFTK